MTALEARVARLEHQLRLYRALSLAALVALVALTALGASRTVPDVIRAHRFEVIDAHGRPLVMLKTTGFGGIVQTVGNDGVSGVSIGASSTGGFVGVRDDKPSAFPRVELSTDETGGMLAVRNWNGFAVEVDRDGLAVAHTREDGNLTRVDPRVVLSVSEHGGHVRVLNATGDEAASLRADETGTGVISAFGPAGKQRIIRPGS
ncbi:MAG TPA: hypothetical protein VKB51_17320 [bacterium]|nr:hypothetical protein [bacterium]